MTFRRLLPVALAAALPALAPTAAHAAGAAVSADDGTPVALGAGPVSIRNMSPSVTLSFGPDEKRYAVSVTGPGGASAASGTSCLGVGLASAERVAYQGNGTYTVTVRTSPDASDSSCAKAGAAQVFTFDVAAGTAVSPPATKLLTREPFSFSSVRYAFGVLANPGADTYELRYAKGAVLNPDGGISTGGERAFVDSSGQAAVSFTDPGTYTFVARATDYGTTASTPWSPPVTVRVLGPFDFTGQPAFADSRGPSYKVKGTVREQTAKGRIKVSVRRGTKGAFRKVGKVKIRRGGRFAVRFKLRKPGSYQLRYQYKGSRTVAGGSVVQGIRITRRVVYG